MSGLRRMLKTWIPFLLALALAIAIGQWSKVGLSTNLAPTLTLAENPALPDWIEQVSPIGEAEPLAQIRIRFKEPLIPLESLEGSNQQLLQHFAIAPALPGRFRFLTPRMVGFQADQAIPKALRAQITLKAGLADLKNHRLDRDISWTFNTEPIKLTDLPGTEGTPGTVDQPLDRNPTLKVSSNVELDLASLQERVSLAPVNNGASIPLKVTLQPEETDDSSPAEKFDPAQKTWVYLLTPQRPLQIATRYQLKIAPGVRALRGNLPTTTEIATQVVTYSSLTFQGLKFIDSPDASGAYGRFVQGGPQLQFNNELVAESLTDNISIQPAAKPGARLFRVYEGDRSVDLNPWAFEPNTRYTITLGANLKDTFGQTLGRTITVPYETGEVAADFWAPSGLNIFPSGKKLELEISSVNLPDASYQAAYQVVQPADLVYIDSPDPETEGGGLLPKPQDWQRSKLNQSPKNQLTTQPIPIQQKLGASTGMLAYGVQARTHLYQDDGKQKWRNATYYGLVQLTNLGVFAQWFPSSGMVRVHHLSDGSPVAEATVDIYKSKVGAKSRPQPTPCATGKTDKTGTLLLAREDLQTCIDQAGGFADAPELLAVAYEGKDWAFTRTWSYSGAYGYGISAGWQGSKPESRGIIFSDRQLYQPGETAWFTGTAYYLQDGSLKQDKNSRYTVTLESPDGKTKALGAQTTNAFGTFSLELPLAATQPLGYYTLRAKGESGAEITGDFRVAEFKLPNFKVNLNLSQEIALINQSVTADTQSNYLFGPAVEGGKTQYYVTRKPLDFTPKGWDTFSFGRKWFWPEQAPTVSSDVLQVNQVLDARGQSRQVVAVGNDLPYPMTYRVDAQVSDVSNLSVGNSKSFTALPSDRLIGLQSHFVADAGKPFSVQVIVTDPAGRAIANQPVRVELQKMTYSSVTQVVEGSRQPRNQVEYKTVAQAETQSGTAPQTVSLTPPEAGSYRIRANFGNATNELTATDTQIWVTGESTVNWGKRYRNNRLDLTLDKETYQPGDTATVLIQSPYPDAELYLAVVRHQTLYRTITHIKGGAPQVQFQVTPDMLPNAAVEAVLIRQGEPLPQLEPGRVKNLVSVGFAPFSLKLDQKYLTVDAQVAKPTLQPGREQTVQLQLKDAQGKPAQGQFTVMVVNEAVLQLSGYRPPDLVKTVYAEQDISTRFADNRPEVVLDPIASPLQKGWGFGGGFAPGAADTRIRKNFKPLAYYNGSAITDANGQVTLTFKLPDDLTTWRVLAVATSGDLRFGNGETTFVTTQPLMANPVFPQFARPGDRFQAGLSVTNSTNQAGTLGINGVVSGSLQLANSGSLQAPLATSATRAYRFPFVANQAGAAKIQFTAQLNGATDAFEVPFEVKPLEITEQVVESGVTNQSVSIPLQVAPTVATDTGGLEVALASTLIPEITAPAKQVLEDEQLPFLEPAASQLAIAANLQILSRKYGQTFTEFNPNQQAAQALARLQALQRPDDGFAAFPGQEQSDPFVSPYVAHSLARATAAGFKVDDALSDRLTSYLKSILANPGQYDFCKTALCKNQVRLEALRGLAALGEKRTDFLADIYAQRDQFDPVMQIKLANYLSLLPNWQTEATHLTQQLQKVVYETGRTATINLPQGWSWLDSQTVAQAQALRLFILQKGNPETLDRLLQALLSLRREGTWATTYDNAEALTALVDYSQLQPTPPNFTASAQLAGKSLGTAQFQGYQKPSVDLKVAIADLPKGRSDLVLQKSGQGLLHYLAAYRYRLQGDQPGRLNGLRVTRTLRPANQPTVLQTIGLLPPNQPLTLPAGQVFDVSLEITTDHPVDHVIITDPLPAGLEAVDSSFQTSTPYFQAQGGSWEIDYQTIHRDRVIAYGNHFDAGIYSLHYLVRSVTPGTFLYPGAEVQLQYAPEEFGRSASSKLVVAE